MKLKQQSNKEYYSKNKERWKKWSFSSKENKAALRRDILANYGGECYCCGESNSEFLAIDHIGGNGRTHRKQFKSSFSYHKWIINNNYPNELRLLCHNCNSAIAYYGSCPHERFELSKKSKLIGNPTFK